jgi:hypothetical protein
MKLSQIRKQFRCVLVLMEGPSGYNVSSFSDAGVRSNRARLSMENIILNIPWRGVLMPTGLAVQPEEDEDGRKK